MQAHPVAGGSIIPIPDGRYTEVATEMSVNEKENATATTRKPEWNDRGSEVMKKNGIIRHLRGTIQGGRIGTK